MATIWTGSLVATGSLGLLATAKTVYLNTDFVYNLSETKYLNASEVATAGRQVLYKAGQGPDMVSLIFSTALATLQTSMNTQPTNKNTLNNVSLVIIPADGSANYTLAVNTSNIWWMEEGATNQAYVTVYDNSLTAPTTYLVSYTGGAAALRTLINN
jgi:hypothetical protein